MAVNRATLWVIVVSIFLFFVVKKWLTGKGSLIFKKDITEVYNVIIYG